MNDANRGSDGGPGGGAVRRTFAARLRFRADPDAVFEALCPVRERMRGELVYSESGGAEEGMIFRVPGREGAADTLYTYARHDPKSRRLEVIGMRPDDRMTVMRIAVDPVDPEDPDGLDGPEGPGAPGRAGVGTTADVSITRTGLSPAGSARVADWTEEQFREEMERWQRDLGGMLGEPPASGA